MLTYLIVLSLIPFLDQPSNGIASYYTSRESGSLTASGEILDDTQLTCAMKNRLFGKYCLVLSQSTKDHLKYKYVICKINDDGPNYPGRLIDLSKAAMARLNGLEEGLIPVSVFVFP